MSKSFILFSKKYGFAGIVAYFKLKLGLTQRISLGGIAGVFTLRPGSSDIAVFKHIFIYDDYSLELDFQPAVIVDAGANIGLASIFFANKYPLARIIAIELSPSNYALLVHNTGSFERIEAVHAGLWHKEEKIYINETNHSHWGHRVDTSSESANSISVRALTVNDFLKEHELSAIDLFKIDIEGAEDELFSENHENWLPKVKVLVIEFHERFKEGSTKRIKQELAKFKFKEGSPIGENQVFINTAFI